MVTMVNCWLCLIVTMANCWHAKVCHGDNGKLFLCVKVKMVGMLLSSLSYSVSGKRF